TARRSRTRGVDERQARIADAAPPSAAERPDVDADRDRDERQEQEQAGPDERHGNLPANARDRTAPATSSPRLTAANTPVSSISSGRTTKAVSIWPWMASSASAPVAP